MYNPFVLLNEKLLDALLRQPLYFVREYYERGVENNSAIIPVLFTHYPQYGVDAEKAKRHFSLIKKDPYRYLYDSGCDEHIKKLTIAAQQPAGYKIYVNIFPDQWTAPVHLRNRVYRYMVATFPEWEKEGNKKLKINIRDLFGKLYLLFSWKGHKAEVLLDEIEKFG
ncbi:MAG: hypothetical protein JSS80_06170 [Bacteroidetes bacterium]|nr:hypothetical protein [Bacteroidota bacterium]